MSLLLRTLPLRSSLRIGLGLSGLFAAQHCLQSFRPSPQILRCDAPAISIREYQRSAKNPVVKEGKLNPKVFSQVSSGSIVGVLGGIAVGFFSKPLAIVIGLGILGAQALESRGLHIIPYQRIQRIFTDTDIKASLQDNVAFKVSLGLTFFLAGFVSF